MDQRTIPMHAFFGLVRRQKDISSAGLAGSGIGKEKAEAVAVNGKASGQIVRFGSGGNEVTGAQFNEQTLFREAVESVFESIAIFADKFQFADELLISAAAVRQRTDMLQQGAVVKLCGTFEKVFRRAAGMLGHYRNYRKSIRLFRFWL